MEWAPRFVVYATLQKRTPEEQLKYDEERFPGGKMAPFSIWIQTMWNTCAHEHGFPTYGFGHLSLRCVDAFKLTYADNQERFDKWLAQRILDGKNMEPL